MQSVMVGEVWPQTHKPGWLSGLREIRKCGRAIEPQGWVLMPYLLQGGPIAS